VPDVDNMNAKGLVTLPVYAGGKNKAGREAARANAEAAREEMEAVRNILAFEVSRGFYTVQKTRNFIKAAEAGVKSLEGNLEVVRKRLAAGSLLKTDLLDMEVRLAEIREDLMKAQNANALAHRTLRNLLGIEEGDFAVVDSLLMTGNAPGTDDFSGRAELAAARHRELAAEEQVRAQKAAYLPRVNAFGSLDYDYGWKYGEGGGSYAAGLLLQWDLWDGQQTRARVREAKANLESAREEQRKLRLALDLEVEQARLGLKSANDRLAVTELAVSSAAESADLTRARFDQGAALSTQLMDAETALINARVRHAEAEADRQIAIAALRKALALPQLDPQPKSENK